MCVLRGKNNASTVRCQRDERILTQRPKKGQGRKTYKEPECLHSLNCYRSNHVRNCIAPEKKTREANEEELAVGGTDRKGRQKKETELKLKLSFPRPPGSVVSSTWGPFSCSSSDASEKKQKQRHRRRRRPRRALGGGREEGRQRSEKRKKKDNEQERQENVFSTCR